MGCVCGNDELGLGAASTPWLGFGWPRETGLGENLVAFTLIQTLEWRSLEPNDVVFYHHYFPSICWPLLTEM